MTTAHRALPLAHLVIAAAAFATWVVVTAVYYLVLEEQHTDGWPVFAVVEVMPSFWCLYAAAAARRVGRGTVIGLVVLAVPVLVGGLVMAGAVAGDLRSTPPRTLLDSAMAFGLCWLPAAPCGFVSFVWAVCIQVSRHFHRPEETGTNGDTEARP